MLLGDRGSTRERLSWGRLLASVVAAVWICLLAVPTVGIGGARSDSARGVGRGASPSRQSAGVGISEARLLAARLRRRALVRSAQRQRWLEGSAARAQRAASRMAFRGLRTGAALSLLVRDYGGELAGVSANPAALVARRGPVVRYEGDYRAVVRTARGLEVEESSVPLRVGGSGAGGRPVDLSLDAGAGGFAPASPLVGLRIARYSGGGVGVGSDGLRVTLEGASVPGRAWSVGRAFSSVGLALTWMRRLRLR